MEERGADVGGFGQYDPPTEPSLSHTISLIGGWLPRVGGFFRMGLVTAFGIPASFVSNISNRTKAIEGFLEGQGGGSHLPLAELAINSAAVLVGLEPRKG